MYEKHPVTTNSGIKTTINLEVTVRTVAFKANPIFNLK